MIRTSAGMGVVMVVAAVCGAGRPARAQRPAPGPGPASAPAATPAGRPVSPITNWENNTALGLELGPGAVLASYSLNDGPSSILFYTSLRASLELAPRWAGQLVFRQWWLPGSDHAIMLAPGARFEPIVMPAGRVFADGAIGPVLTDNNFTWGLDLGGGIEWDIPDVAGLSIGPYFRYGYVMDPDERTSRDGHGWSIGASFTYHLGRAAAAPKTAAPVRTPGGRYRITIPDSDHDGIGDDRDECPRVPVGKHPDPFKTGCPENDEDADGIPDSADACPVLPPGDKPDPNRPGCPIVDSDGDGILDYQDACPGKAGVASPDRAHNGCPVKGEKPRGTVETPAPPPPEMDPTPKTVRKRQMK